MNIMILCIGLLFVHCMRLSYSTKQYLLYFNSQRTLADKYDFDEDESRGV